MALCFFVPRKLQLKARPVANLIHDGQPLFLRSMSFGGAGCCKGSSSAAAAAHPPSGSTAQQDFKSVVLLLAEGNRRRLLPRSIHGGRPLPVRSMYSDSAAWCQKLSGGAAAAHPPNGNTTSQTNHTGVVAKENINAGKKAWEQSVNFGVKMVDNLNPTAKLVLGVMTGVAAVKLVLVESTEPKVKEGGPFSDLSCEFKRRVKDHFKKSEDEERANYQTHMSFKEKKAEKETRQVLEKQQEELMQAVGSSLLLKQAEEPQKDV